jgi:hypothetical protein
MYRRRRAILGNGDGFFIFKRSSGWAGGQDGPGPSLLKDRKMNQVTKDSAHAEQRGEILGFFENNSVATATTGGNNNGWRRFRRNGIFPHVFFTYLRESGIIKQDAWVPEKVSTVGAFLDFLKCYPYESEQARSIGDYLFRQILKADIPSLTKTYSQGGHA